MNNRRGNRSKREGRSRGFSFIDTLVGIALMTIVFFALLSAFRYSIMLLGLAKMQITAIALADEQIEYIRSLSYDSIGTVSGIPSGSIPQTETILLNKVSYTRRTLIQYEDAPQDGLGGSDTNGLTADYKRVKVEMSWYAKDIPHTYAITSTIVPKGVESVSGGGTLRIYVLSALGAPIEDALVRIQNPSTTPAIDVSVYTNSAGKVEFPGGTPAASGYQVTVTKQGYNSAQTYSVSVGNPNPTPGHLTVVVGGTTSATFAIDRLGGMIVKTYSPLQNGAWSDTFTDSSQTTLMASTSVSGGRAGLIIDPLTSDFAPQGEIRSETIAPSYLVSWGSLSWNQTVPSGTEIRYRVYYFNGSSYVLIPDAALSGNSVGTTTSPISLSGLATTTYSSLRVDAVLSASAPSTTPFLNDWQVSYQGGPTPLPNIPFSMRGLKTIGTDGGGSPIYKYSANNNSGAGSSIAIPSLEWDTYQVTVSSATGYDVGESCNPQPTSVSPGATTTVSLTLVPHTTNSLLLYVRDNNGNLVSGASAHLYGGATDTTITTSSCGQAFFSNLSAVTSYTLDVSKTGFQSTSITPVDVSGGQTLPVTLTP